MGGSSVFEVTLCLFGSLQGNPQEQRNMFWVLKAIYEPAIYHEIRAPLFVW